MVRSASEFIIGPRFARTRWRVSNHEARGPSFETPHKSAAPQDEVLPPRPRTMISTAATSSRPMQP